MSRLRLHSHCRSLTYLRHLRSRTWTEQVVGCPSVFVCSHSKEGVLEALGRCSSFFWVWDFVVVFKLFALMPYDMCKLVFLQNPIHLSRVVTFCGSLCK